MTIPKEDEKTPGPKFWFDTEFIEDGRTIDLMSIGVVCEDGREYYAEPLECDLSRASDWVKENVIPHLTGEKRTRLAIRDDLLAFMGEKPEIWAYYADYDWLALCQLFGTMMDLPKGWPMFCRDLKQLAGDTPLIEQKGIEHNALADARWTREAWLALNRNAYTSTDALRSALARTIAVLESVERDTNYGIHDEYEPRDRCTCELCKARAALSGRTCRACKGFGCVDDDPEVRGSVTECWKCGGSGFDSPAPSTEGLREALALYEQAIVHAEAILGGEYADFDGPFYDIVCKARDAARTALAGVTAPSEVDGK